MSKCPEEPEDRVGGCFLFFVSSLGPLLLLRAILVPPAFSQASRLREAALSCHSKQDAAQLPGHSSTLGQVLSNLSFWSTCLNIVQSSLVTVGWYGWVGQDRAALCRLSFTYFLALLHDLSPRQKEKKAGRACLPQREKVFRRAAGASARCCGNRSWLFLSGARAWIREVPSETGNYGLTQFESLFSSALLFNHLGHSHLQKKIF